MTDSDGAEHTLGVRDPDAARLQAGPGVAASFEIWLRELEADIFDLDGVVTRTPRLHAVVWKQMFDVYLRSCTEGSGLLFERFNAVSDYRKHVDGKPPTSLLSTSGLR